MRRATFSRHIQFIECAEVVQTIHTFIAVGIFSIAVVAYNSQILYVSGLASSCVSVVFFSIVYIYSFCTFLINSVCFVFCVIFFLFYYRERGEYFCICRTIFFLLFTRTELHSKYNKISCWLWNIYSARMPEQTDWKLRCCNSKVPQVLHIAHTSVLVVLSRAFLHWYLVIKVISACFVAQCDVFLIYIYKKILFR